MPEHFTKTVRLCSPPSADLPLLRTHLPQLPALAAPLNPQISTPTSHCTVSLSFQPPRKSISLDPLPTWASLSLPTLLQPSRQMLTRALFQASLWALGTVENNRDRSVFSLNLHSNGRSVHDDNQARECDNDTCQKITSTKYEQ